MNSTKFSLISLVYNTKEEYLRFALSSLLEQHYYNYEIIIIDDGSNQETKEILKEYEEKCIIHHQENKGMPQSRIEGIKIATGDYIIFVDSDDYLNLDTLKLYNEIIQEHHSDIVMQDFVKFTGTLDNILKKNKFFEEGVIPKETVLKELCRLHTNGTCGRAVRRELFDHMEDYIDKSFNVGEDVQQSTHVILKANSFYYTSEKIYYYRIVEEHRDYYSIKNINDCNFMTPVYHQLFRNDEHKDLLPIFKSSAANSITFNAFRICLFANNKQEKNDLLNQLHNLEIVSIIDSIKEKLPLFSGFLYQLFSKKHYFLLGIFAKIYDLVYGMQKL